MGYMQVKNCKEEKRIIKCCWLRTLSGMLLAGALLLGGCGDYPDLTDEQVEQAGEYAAMMLLKYDSQSRSRLMSIADMEAEQLRRDSWEKAAQIGKKAAMEEKDKEQESGEAGHGVEEQGREQFLPTAKLQDGFVLPDGVNIAYVGYSLSKQYPEDHSDYFAIVATTGKKILALSFEVTNNSEGSQSIDMVNQNNLYRITVNEQYTRSNLTTLLENDLANYQGKLLPGESVELVLLIEVDEEIWMDSLKMKLKNDRNEYTIQLEPQNLQNYLN